MTPALHAPWTTRPDFAKLLVLVVEDDADSCQFLGEVLRMCGAVVVEADNVAAAKEFVGHTKFELIVTDLALPGEDGAAFLKWLRQQPRERNGSTPAVAVTAFYQQFPPGEVSGWAAYFQKPVDIEQFVRTVADILHVPIDRV